MGIVSKKSKTHKANGFYTFYVTIKKIKGLFLECYIMLQNKLLVKCLGFFLKALAKNIVTFILLNFHIQTFLPSIPVSSNGTQIFFKCLLKAKHKHHGLANHCFKIVESPKPTTAPKLRPWCSKWFIKL